jgi:hypothetical protein
MIAFFCVFRQFSAKKLAFSSKTNVMSKILQILTSVPDFERKLCFHDDVATQPRGKIAQLLGITFAVG